MNTKEIVRLYTRDNLSCGAIAKREGTYPNAIRRILLGEGVEMRSKSQAQKIALKAGRSPHPTKGKERTDAAKMKISGSMVNHWDSLTDEEMREKSEMGRKQWDGMTVQEKRRMHEKAHKAIREAAENGSKLEKEVHRMLMRAGINFTPHKKNVVKTQKQEVDIHIPSLKMIIEVDGISHFKPIWGEDKLIKQQKSDKEKDGTFLRGGFHVIRIANLSNSMAIAKLDKLEKTLLETIEQLSEGPESQFKEITHD